MMKFRPKRKEPNFKALFSVIKFFVFIGGLFVLVYRYRQEISGQVKKLSSKYDKVDSFVKSIKSAVEEFEDQAEDFQDEAEEWADDFQEKAEVWKTGAEKKAKKFSRKADKKVKELKKQIKELDADSPFKLNERQEAIYNVIKSAGEATMSDIGDVIAGVTSRTLRRDTTKLEKLGLIEQVGKTKSSLYRIRK